VSFDLETVLTSKSGFGLVTASPLQRAICRIADGLPLGELAADADVRRALNCDPADLPSSLPSELYLLSGVRCGKSLFAAALAVRATQIVDVSQLSPGDEVRVSVMALHLDSAKPILGHIRGAVQSSALKGLLIGEVGADSVTLRHPSGRPIEIKIIAGQKAGGSLVSRWSAGAIFDEAPRMNGAEDGVVNFEHARDAVVGRLLPKAQMVALGSPWAPFGPVYDVVEEFWGRPDEHRVIIRGTGPAMNPTWWTEDRAAKLAAKNPVAYRTDVLGEFADPEGGLIAPEDLEAVVIGPSDELDRMASRPGWVAAMDPSSGGSKRNAWTMVLARALDDGAVLVGHAEEWRGLAPDETLAKVAAVLRRFGLAEVFSDQYSAAALNDLARKRGFAVVQRTTTAATKLAMFDDLAALVSSKRIGIVKHAGLLADLAAVRRRITQAGASIHLPKTTDGRHCDFAPSAALAVAEVSRGVREIVPEYDDSCVIDLPSCILEKGT
jgi:hypothetical protein